MFTKRFPLLFITLMVLFLWSSIAVSALALGAFTSAEDTFVNRLDPDTNFNASLLNIEQDVGIGGGSVPQNKVAYLKFDISGQTEEITTATLILSSVTGTSCVGSWNTAVTLDVYGVSVDSWSASTLTWNNATTDGMMDLSLIHI